LGFPIGERVFMQRLRRTPTLATRTDTAFGLADSRPCGGAASVLSYSVTLRPHSRLERTINTAVAVLAAYLFSALILPWPAVTMGLFGLALVATGWMAVRILRDPYSTDATFDEQFYRDRPDIRRTP
jgi:hypothetical protein